MDLQGSVDGNKPDLLVPGLLAYMIFLFMCCKHGLSIWRVGWEWQNILVTTLFEGEKERRGSSQRKAGYSSVGEGMVCMLLSQGLSVGVGGHGATLSEVHCGSGMDSGGLHALVTFYKNSFELFL